MCTTNRRSPSTNLGAAPEEYLENGYAVQTPTGDNLVLDFARAEAEGFGVLIEAAGGRAAHDPDAMVHLLDAGIPTPFGNAALLDGPTPVSVTYRCCATRCGSACADAALLGE